MTIRVDSLGDALVRMIQHIAKEAAREAVQKKPDKWLKTHEKAHRETAEAIQKSFTAREVAERLGVDPNAVYMRQARRKLPRGKMKLADVIEWEHERQASPSGQYGRRWPKLNGSSRHARMV
jgi:FixJ family two-component response regulator